MSVKFQDYYELLGLKRNASEKEIKAAYRKLARKWHPDLHTVTEKEKAEEKFKRINEAYEVLKDPEKRSRYDRLGSKWKDGQDFQAQPDMDGVRYSSVNGFESGGYEVFDGGFSDFFNTFFGGRAAGSDYTGRTATQRGTVRGKDVESKISLSLEEAYQGVVRSLKISGQSVCPVCGGEGTRGRSFCPNCSGTGAVPDEKILDVKVPAGVKEGSHIRLKGQGGTGLGGGSKGDLLLKVTLQPHPVFKLAGSDIEVDAVIRPDQAAFGDMIPVKTITGQVNVKVPPNSRSGSRLRLRGKGFPRKNNTYGDQYVRLVIDLPTDLSKEEKALYKQLHELRKGGV